MENTKGRQEDVIFVGGATPTKGLASCIFSSSIKDRKDEIRLRAIGAGAISQMTKAYIIAKGNLSEKGIKASIDMHFKDIESKREGEETISAVEFVVTFKS